MKVKVSLPITDIQNAWNQVIGKLLDVDKQEALHKQLQADCQKEVDRFIWDELKKFKEEQLDELIHGFSIEKYTK